MNSRTSFNCPPLSPRATLLGVQEVCANPADMRDASRSLKSILLQLVGILATVAAAALAPAISKLTTISSTVDRVSLEVVSQQSTLTEILAVLTNLTAAGGNETSIEVGMAKTLLSIDNHAAASSDALKTLLSASTSHYSDVDSRLETIATLQGSIIQHMDSGLADVLSKQTESVAALRTVANYLAQLNSSLERVDAVLHATLDALAALSDALSQYHETGVVKLDTLIQGQSNALTQASQAADAAASGLVSLLARLTALADQQHADLSTISQQTTLNSTYHTLTRLAQNATIHSQEVNSKLTAIEHHQIDLVKAVQDGDGALLAKLAHYQSTFDDFAVQQHVDLVEIASLELNISGEHINITLDILDLDSTAKKIYDLMAFITEDAPAGLSLSMFHIASNTVKYIAEINQFLGFILEGATEGLVAKMLELAAAANATLADSLTALHNIDNQTHVSTAKLADMTKVTHDNHDILSHSKEDLDAIKKSTAETAEALSEGFDAKVVKVVDSTPWDINMPEPVWADSRLLALEFAAMECASCGGGTIGLPFECEACAIELAEVEGIDGDELNGPGSTIISVKGPPGGTKRATISPKI